MSSINEDEGEVAFFSVKRWDRRNRADLIESATPSHDAQVVGYIPGIEPTPFDCSGCKLTEDYTTVQQQLHFKAIGIKGVCALLSIYI